MILVQPVLPFFLVAGRWNCLSWPAPSGPGPGRTRWPWSSQSFPFSLLSVVGTAPVGRPGPIKKGVRLRRTSDMYVSSLLLAAGTALVGRHRVDQPQTGPCGGHAGGHGPGSSSLFLVVSRWNCTSRSAWSHLLPCSILATGLAIKMSFFLNK